MFGLSKREQRWKEEQKACEALIGFAAKVALAHAEVRIAEAKVEEARLLKQASENVKETK